MRNIILTIEYDGEQYVGWQRQLNGKSIQGEIENALKTILQEQVNVIGAGRTDAGVHARGQVANFQTNTSLELYQIKSALNSSLSDDIVVHDAVDVEEDFHARYNAKQRVYKYFIRQNESALERKYSWFVRYELDIERMREVAQTILGEHDFEGFAKVGSDVKHFVCHVSMSEWQVGEKRLTYTISADRFLRGMVRALVGTMIDVGRGFLSPDIFKERLDNRLKYEPRSAAPAHGLVLEQVFY
ncbi:MAG: tRNA pseudouridine(38-40) synthase TruA [Ignavibacteriae bacterium]|nr:tRNA pseudouridine(38-40) synthase TruA [Ignavibacteriota bacterium]